MRLAGVGRRIFTAAASRHNPANTGMLPKVLSSPTAQKLAHASFSSSRPFASRVSTQPSFPRTTPVCAYAASLPHRGYSTGDKPHPLDSNPNVESPLRDATVVTKLETPQAISGAVHSATTAGTPDLASTSTISSAGAAAGSAGTADTPYTSTSGPSAEDKPNPLAASTNVNMRGVNTEPPSASRYTAGPGTSAGPAGPETSAGTQQEQPGGSSGLPRLVVFGGNGFVGSRVCEQALKTGLSVVSISRSGRPKALAGAAWADSIDWVQADAFEPATYRDQLQGAVGVVSCLGGFGSNEQMFKICGEANITAINEAAEAGVGRFVFISVHDYRFPGFFLSGYFQGKRKAENALAAKFPEGGVALRPGFIHGTRSVGSVGIPLGLVGTPLEKALGFLPTKTLASVPLLGAGFVPPVSVTAVAKAAVAAATDPSVPGGIMDVWEIAQLDATSG